MRYAIFVLFLLLSTQLYAKSIFSNKTQAQTSQYINTLKDLIVATQKTRGVTLAYINGDEATLLLIHSYSSDTREAISRLKNLSLSKDPEIADKLHKLSISLSKLNKEALKLPPDVVFDRFSNSVAKEMELVKLVEQKNHKKLDKFSQNALNLMINTMLPLTESMGQLRALGTGAAASGAIDNNETESEMLELIQKIKHLQNKLEARTLVLNNNYPDEYDIDVINELEIISYAIDNYIALSKSELLKDNITYSAIRYFEVATSTIGTIIVLFDANNRAIASDADGWF